MKNNIHRFPFAEVSKVAEKESWRKEIYRPIYHIHKWWAQRLGSVFRSTLLYLFDGSGDNVWKNFYKKNHYSDLVVLDPFMGSGTTIGEALKLGARAIGCDINPVSSFLVRQELTTVNDKDLIVEFNKLQDNIAPKIKDYYKTLDPKTGKELRVLYYFWVKVATTPQGEQIPLFSKYVFAQNAYPSKNPSASIICPHCGNVIRGRYDSIEQICPNCNFSFNPQKGPACKSTVEDSKGVIHKIKDLIPIDSVFPEKMYAKLAIDDNGNKVYLPISNYDIQLYERAQLELQKYKEYLPTYEVPPGYNTDQAIGYGYTSWRSFFNDRQLLCLSILLDGILNIQDEKVREQFLCLFSSTLEFNNTFCSYKGEGTGAVRPIFSNHILKPERTPLENSVWGIENSSGCFSTLFYSKLLPAKHYLDEPFEIRLDPEGKCSKIVASDQMQPYIASDWDDFIKHRESALILNGDSSQLPIPDNSVDFVVTDPPYFDFIHYSELSDFFYAWLSPILKERYNFFNTSTSRRDNEVQQQNPDRFARLLGNVFSEAYRVCRATGKLAFSFHHSRPEGWISIAKAIKLSGFYISEVFPVHAELMASTPKSSAKEPISIDAMIICSKNRTVFSQDKVKTNAINDVLQLYDSGKKLSKSDLFVISAAHSIKCFINNDLNESNTINMIDFINQELQTIQAKEDNSTLFPSEDIL